MALSSVSSCEPMDDEMSIMGSDTDDTLGGSCVEAAQSAVVNKRAFEMSESTGTMSTIRNVVSEVPKSLVVSFAASPKNPKPQNTTSERSAFPHGRKNRRRPFRRNNWKQRAWEKQSQEAAPANQGSRNWPKRSSMPVHMRLGHRSGDFQSADAGHCTAGPSGGWRFKTRTHSASRVYHNRQRGNTNKSGNASSRSSGDRLNAAAANAIADVSKRVTSSRISDMFHGARETLTSPVKNGGFRAEHSSPWSPVLNFGLEQFNPEGRRITWDTLVTHGENLYKLFEVRSHAAEAARSLRDLVMRGENLLEALASADETISWCKMIITKNLPMRTRDPIIHSSIALLENLRLKLEPFMRCYLSSSGSPTLAELCDHQRLSDVACVPTFMFVTLARIARAVGSGAEAVSPDALGPAGHALANYVPGTCLAGTLEAIDLHKRRCKESTCSLVSSYTLVPVYLHGKYFYCNQIF
ncbi:multifunctional expression regulator [Equid alphaherpesvirus 4]|uniref:5 n=2 Tax=Equid alphaherpesvirus 4 TaxID=10331 RepID=A0A288CG09_EHV4|nr:multifunctional expression regulator [Equid alphaherpesvirus 4]AAC59567.1 5 [Equid alphaherpesvirus 4] [Equid alphaherpesvirus 4]AMB16045.1 multifunctional expression regulator [Equid alphaherpesvirus 4]AMB16124.1 multifunctional expression regulator [Equid alphaherpesvirus 4]AMB16203.1 multifunctional expression regulator [Equid alphaherpesvirus 4]AMB16282.1 multifunctional expression regulator [Equid alphaherpesvirus 4]